MKLTFIWTSTTGSETKFDALEYQPGSSSYSTKIMKQEILAKVSNHIKETWTYESGIYRPPIFSQKAALTRQNSYLQAASSCTVHL